MANPDNPKPTRTFFDWRFRLLAAVAAVICVALGLIYREALGLHLTAFFRFVTDKEQVADFVRSFGIFAPLAFVAFQFLQVIFAPVPGEATGFIGGYIFGASKGFLLSTIGLTLGSLTNFLIGRYLGNHVIRRLIPENTLRRFDAFLRHQGVIIVFFLFVLPGFPKDYFCLFLGLSKLPVKLFMLISTVGRMPGTLMLSLQGALLFDRNYGWLTVLVVACLLLVVPAYRYREALYRWIEKFNHKPDEAP
ncbi:MAG: TVP38/TMEM64 family protein [Deltaproteobacteria bacterium]|nr:TVP38/TMEM64 family protein [Deltaproteobacteria bacterium]